MEENTPQLLPDSPSKSAGGSSKIAGGIAFIAFLGAIAAWFFGRTTENAMAPASDSSATENARDSIEGAGSDASMGDISVESPYKDGSYSAEGTYVSPAGPENIGVVLILQNGMVKNVVFQGGSDNPKSKMFQEKFSEELSSQVIGKPVDKIDLTVVNGSSLTPKGFMDALEKIKQEAKV